MTTTTRLEKLNASLRTSGLDAVALNPGSTLTYLTGAHFHLMERPVVLLVAPGQDPALILPELEMLKVDHIPYTVQAFPYGESPSGWGDVFRNAVQALGLDEKRIGVETERMRLLEYNYVRSGAPSAEFPDASETLGLLRLHKDQDEIENMRKQMFQQFGGAGAQDLDLKSMLPDEMFADNAEQRVKLGLVMAEYINRNELKADPDRIRQTIEEMASTYQEPEEVIKYYYSDQEQLAGVESKVLEDQAVEKLLESANIVENECSYQEAIQQEQQPEA